MTGRTGKNPNGEGSIYQRKDGRFEAAAYVTTSAGTRKRVRLYGRTWEEVHRRLVEVKAQEHRGIPTPAQSYTVGTFLDDWLAHIAAPSVRATTYAKYETFVRLYLKPGLGSRRPGPDWNDSAHVFTTRHGTPIEPRNLARSFERLSAGLPRIRLHDLRHLCASFLAYLQVPPRTIMEILGHSQIAVTMNVYTHVTSEEQRQAMRLMDGLLSDPGAADTGEHQ